MAEDSLSPAAVERGHEVREVNARAVVASGIGVALLMIASALIVYLIIGAFAPRDQGIQVPRQSMPRALAPAPSGELPGAPTASPDGLAARQAATLRGYRWINKEAGIVRIPIERAMSLIAERGLPKFNQRPASTARRQ